MTSFPQWSARARRSAACTLAESNCRQRRGDMLVWAYQIDGARLAVVALGKDALLIDDVLADFEYRGGDVADYYRGSGTEAQQHEVPCLAG